MENYQAMTSVRNQKEQNSSSQMDLGAIQKEIILVLKVHGETGGGMN